MSRQIQIRRGTAAENDAFTGAIGEVTMDTTNKTLRVHDGVTVGGIELAKKSEIPEEYTLPNNYDFVIESQLPTAANNYTWYRKYKSGWVEQGCYNFMNGYIRGEYFSVTLPITMADANYQVSLNFESKNANYHSGTDFYLGSDNYSSSGFYYWARGGDGSIYKVSSSWEVKGMAAVSA